MNGEILTTGAGIFCGCKARSYNHSCSDTFRSPWRIKDDIILARKNKKLY